MMNPHTSEPFGPVILGLAIMAVGPALLTDPVIATLTATPLRQAVSATILLGLLAGWSLWMVPGVSIRAAVAGDGGES
jgi:hypothetical protein